MENIFRSVLNMSITGSYVILAVMLVRLLLRKAPKKYSLLLWGAAAFRLCCPVSFESVLSLFRLPVFDMTTAQSASPAALTYIPESPQGTVTTGISAVNLAIDTVVSQTAATPATGAQIDWMALGAALWCAGMAFMVVFSIFSYLRLTRQLRPAVRVGENVWQSDAISSPFILGFFRPRIYLPVGLTIEEREYVLAHERTHLELKDHFLKPFAYSVLTVHWFNPLCHLAFRLMTRDLEMRCDETVLARHPDFCKPYSATLVSLASAEPLPAPSPLAFGETGIASRVKNILHWKKPKVWVSLAAAGLTVLSLVACAANPLAANKQEPAIVGQEFQPYNLVYHCGAYSYSEHYVSASQNRYYVTENGELYGLNWFAGEWDIVGQLFPFELTEENFDSFFYPYHPEDAASLHNYDPSVLRSHVVYAWRVESIIEDPIYYDRTFTYILQTDSGQIYACYGQHMFEEPGNGQMAWLVWLTPTVDGGDEPLLEEGTYVTGGHIYQSPTVTGTPKDSNGSVYAVADGRITIVAEDDHGIHEGYLITGRVWEAFPFTQAEWDAMAPDCPLAYAELSKAEYLDLAPDIFLLRLDSTLYLCEGSYDPLAPYRVNQIYALTAQ